jgi:hypothetical protein
VFLERRTVSRKTPGDGRLEITKIVAQRLEHLGPTFIIDAGGDHVRGAIGTFACTCRGESNPHVHYFLESERLKQLSPGSEVDVELDEASNRVILKAAQ